MYGRTFILQPAIASTTASIFGSGRKWRLAFLNRTQNTRPPRLSLESLLSVPSLSWQSRPFLFCLNTYSFTAHVKPVAPSVDHHAAPREARRVLDKHVRAVDKHAASTSTTTTVAADSLLWRIFASRRLARPGELAEAFEAAYRPPDGCGGEAPDATPADGRLDAEGKHTRKRKQI